MSRTKSTRTFLNQEETVTDDSSHFSRSKAISAATLVPTVMDIDNDKRVHDDHLGLYGDKSSIAILMFLYVLQGVPLGLSASIPYLLQNRHVSYRDQAIFSFAHWPFSLKLLWAPVVDSIYLPAFGRRKSWLVPVQYLIGLCMFVLATRIDDLLGDDSAKSAGVQEAQTEVNILMLTVLFFILNFLAATQDVAVDGWSITMLSRRNIGWSSTCNSAGQAAGYFLGYIVFLALESADICNWYLRSEPDTQGIVTLKGFLFFWGLIFCIATTLVMLLKSEVAVCQWNYDTSQSISDAYRQLYRIMRMPAVFSLIIVILTNKIGFAAGEAVSGLKLIEGGLPREHLALIGVPLVPLEILLPLFLSRYSNGPRPMDIYLRSMPYRLVFCLMFAIVVSLAASAKLPDGHFASYYYVLISVAFMLHQVASNFMYVCVMAFFAKISDPTIGGTYMTLLNTVSNLGMEWPSTLALWLVDTLTWRGCVDAENDCHYQAELCTTPVRSCIFLDGYYLESAVCFLIGAIWIKTRGFKVTQLQDLPAKDWACS